MRAELVAIHTALTTFVTHDELGMFTDSLSRLQSIRHHHTNPSTKSANLYHHHKLMLDSITERLETRSLLGLRTTLHKIRAHIHIRGNDLVPAAAKLAVTHYDTLPPSQKRRIETGEIAPRPHYRVMYTAKPPPPPTAPHTGTNCATPRRLW